MDGNKTVTATFTADEYALTVNVVGNGAVGKDPDQATYLYSDAVTLTATARSGLDIRLERGLSGTTPGEPRDGREQDGHGDVHG